jgi:hypothetical protein
MPLIIEGDRVPPRWAEIKNSRPVGSDESYGTRADCIRIAFLNNMPDAGPRCLLTEYSRSPRTLAEYCKKMARW